MLKRIEKVKHLGVFRDLDGSALPCFNTVTIIYGGNGAGKTTLAALLDAARSGDAKYTAGRRTLGDTEDSTADIRTDDGVLLLRKNLWNAAHPVLEVFYQGFVDRNVYTGHLVTTEHKQNLCEFVLGQASVSLAKRVRDLDDLAHAATRRLGEYERSITTHIVGSMAVAEFIALPPVADLDRELEKARKDHSDALAIEQLLKRSRPELLPDVKLDEAAFKAFAASALADVPAEAVRFVATHIQTVLEPKAGERWLRYGWEHLRDDVCPFCLQPVDASKSVPAYRALFSDSYSAHLRSLADAYDSLKPGVSAEQISALSAKTTTALHLAKTWAQDCGYDESQFEVSADLWADWAEASSVLDDGLVEKMNCPTVALRLDEGDQEALDTWRRCADEYTVLRQRVQIARNAIDARLQALSKIKPLELAARLSRLVNTRARYDDKVAPLCNRYRRLVEARGRISAARTAQRELVDSQMATLLEDYASGINKYLRNFGTNIRIVGQRVDNRSKQPKVEYKLLVGGHEVDLGSEKSLPADTCLRNTLSDGDRNALAFAFFLAHLDRLDLARCVVVIDDPVNSMDRHRRSQTCGEILRIAREARQVVLLTHEPRLARTLWKETPDNRIATFALERGPSSQQLVVWDAERGTADRYFRAYFDLCDYLENGGDAEDAMLRVRQLMEGYLRHRFPGAWLPKDWLGDMCRKIRSCTAPDPLAQLYGHFYDELADINFVTKDYHHDGGDAVLDDVECDDAQARSTVARALALVGYQ